MSRNTIALVVLLMLIMAAVAMSLGGAPWGPG
jgi:hypothetical protein